MPPNRHCRQPHHTAIARAFAAACSLALAPLFCLPALAAPPSLALPLRCTPGQDCLIQNYVDHAPGPSWQDYACGRLSYDGHAGTDFRLMEQDALQQGVAVVAAADGTVIGMRDGEPDDGVTGLGPKAAGNAVRIAHGDGWETQYSHLRSGSVAVRMGQQVKAGDPLGLVGLSGNTEFPHVDFAVRHAGRVIDPFAPEGSGDCLTPPTSLWKPEVAARLQYAPTAIIRADWSGLPPELVTAKRGARPAPPSTTSSLLFWVELLGAQAGDQQSTTLYDGSGALLASKQSTIPGNKALWLTYVGKEAPEGGWPPGSYRAEYQLTRNGKVIASVTRSLLLR